MGSLDWCGSVGWALSHKLKGLWFNSWSGHMPWSLCKRQSIMFPSLSFSFPSLLLKKKKKKKKKEQVERDFPALASVAQLVGALSSNQKVASSIPNQGTYLGRRFHFTSWGACRRQPIDQCFPLSLSHENKIHLYKIFFLKRDFLFPISALIPKKSQMAGGILTCIP